MQVFVTFGRFVEISDTTTLPPFLTAAREIKSQSIESQAIEALLLGGVAVSMRSSILAGKFV